MNIINIARKTKKHIGDFLWNYTTSESSVSKPDYFHVAHNKAGKVHMTWAKVPGVSGYIISGYIPAEEEEKKGHYIEIKRFDPETTSYRFKLPDNLRYPKYRICAYKKKFGNEHYSGNYTVGAQTLSTLSKKDINIVGHRGVMDECPENTKVSFERAHEYGYDFMETDFVETNSGDLLICHDLDMSKMFGIEGSMLDVTLENRFDYPIIHGSNVDKYEPQYIMSVEEVLAQAKEWGTYQFLHVKRKDMSIEGFKKLYDLLEKYDMLNQATVFASYPVCVKKMMNFDWNYGFLKIPKTYEDILKGYRVAKKHKVKFFLMKFHPDLPEEIVKRCHKSGIKVGCYDVNNVKRASILKNIGVDYVIMNKKVFKE